MREYEIMRCPHCGGNAVLTGRKNVKVECTRCGAVGPAKPFKSQAVEAWNRRIDDKLFDENDFYRHGERKKGDGDG